MIQTRARAFRQINTNIGNEDGVDKQANLKSTNLNTFEPLEKPTYLKYTGGAKKLYSTQNAFKSTVNDENKILQSKLPVSKFQSKIPVFKSIQARPTQQQVVKKIYSPKIENIDREKNCLLLSDYAAEIYDYLHELEKKQFISKNFLSIKNSATANMRAILINWIISVHDSYHICNETLFLAVSIIDRFFEREEVPKARIQLVGATALFIACKFEEVYYPPISDFVSVCDNLYNKRDFFRMELKILKAIDFELGRPLPLHFLRRGSKAAHSDGRTHMMAKYLCELALIEYECAHWNPSLLAATSLYISLHINGKNDADLKESAVESIWNATIEHYTGYSEEQVAKHSTVLCKLLLSIENSKFQNTRNKYDSYRFMSISRLSDKSIKIIKQLLAKNSTKTELKLKTVR